VKRPRNLHLAVALRVKSAGFGRETLLLSRLLIAANDPQMTF
jgi:hypothetical protein